MSQLQEQLDSCPNLRSAMPILAGSGQRGVLHISSCSLGGALSFADGKITAACINDSDIRGLQALHLLLQLELATLVYTSFDVRLIAPRAPLSVDVRTLFTEEANAGDSNDDGGVANEDTSEHTVRSDIGIAGASEHGVTTPPESAVQSVTPPAVEREKTPTDSFQSASGSRAAEQGLNTSIDSEERFKHMLFRIEESLNKDNTAGSNHVSAMGSSRTGSRTDSDALSWANSFTDGSQEFMLDDKPFESGEKLLDESKATLSSEQRRLLEVYRNVKDADQFGQTTGMLSDGQSIVNLPDEVEPTLESPVERIAPIDDLGLGIEEDPRLSNFVVEPPPEAVCDEPTPEILSFNTLPEDYEARDKLNVHDQFIVPNEEGPVNDAVYEGPLPGEGPRPLSARAIGFSIFLALWVAVIVVPAVITSTAKTDDQLAKQQLRQVVAEELKDEVPYDVAKPESQQATGAADPVTSPSNAITEAQDDAAHGRYEQAIRKLEEKLSVNPEAVQVRAELIRLLIAQKQFKKARALAVTGFRNYSATPTDQRLFWSLYMKCQVKAS